jgi:hypothetical protein
MPIINLFSKREKLKHGEMPDVYQYKQLPKEFRVQVVHILRDILGEIVPYSTSSGYAVKAYKTIHDALCREYGVFFLTDNAENGRYDLAIFNYFLNCESIEKSLDIIEFSFRHAVVAVDSYYRYNEHVQLSPYDGIEELNVRFRENGIGYQYESGEIIRVDSQVSHSEIIKPALHLLNAKIYSGANQEYLKAHEHYRHGRYKECLNECLKSFESIMKAICKKHNWQYNDSDTAKRLLDVCFQNNLVPAYLQTHFSSLRSSLESGVPTVRNKLSGHGQGNELVNVPEYMASYLLNLTATTILFLANGEKEIP